MLIHLLALGQLYGTMKTQNFNTNNTKQTRK